MIDWSKKIVKFFKSAIGQPYVDIKIVHVGETVSFEIDYNAAFIRDLDKHGYADLPTPDEKVGEYLKNVLAMSFSGPEEEEEE